MTDTHAQLLPVYFREPSVNLGIGAMQAKPPHLVGRAFLDRFGIKPDSADAYAFTFLDFEKSAARFGKLGGFAHLKTLIDRLRNDAAPARSLLLDGGDLWQGSGLANTLQGADMVEAANLLGIEAMTGHWEFTYGEKALRANLERFKGEFLAQNVFLTEEAALNLGDQQFVAMPVDGTEIVVQHSETGRADGGVDLAVAPGAAHRVGDDHGDGDAKPLAQLGAQPRGAGIRVDG